MQELEAITLWPITYWLTTARRYSGAESHKVATWDEFPRSFEETPIVPAEKPTEPEKNKHVRWDAPMATKVDAEIKRMNVEGEDKPRDL